MNSSPTYGSGRQPTGQIPIGVALAAYERAVRMSPHDAPAIASYDKVIRRLRPHYTEAHYNRANALCELPRYAEAVAGYGHAIEKRRTNFRELNKLVLGQLGEPKPRSGKQEYLENLLNTYLHG